MKNAALRGKPGRGFLLYKMKFGMLAIAVCGLNAFAAAPGKHVSGDYLMSVDGRRVEVVRVPMPEKSGGCVANELERQPYSYAPFVATGMVEVCVRSGFIDLSKTEILPKSKGVAAISQSVDTVVFRMTPPMTLVLEPRGRHRALVVSANLPEADPPVEGDAKVRYFGPGFHHPGKIALGDGETLYLAPGAWVEGWLQAQGRGITVCGSGVLSGACWDWHQGPRDEQGVNLSGRLATLSGEDIAVRDVTLFSSWGWTLVFNAVTNVVADNVKIICGRVINDDGIDICRARDVTIRNSFVRCQDDCITPKWWCENLACTNLTLWTDAANAFRTGYECEPGASGLVYRNLLFKDVDILHLSLNRRPASDYWVNSAICIQPAHGQPMHDIRYEDIRFHEVGPDDIFLNVKTMPITQGSTLCRTDEAGMLYGLTLRNINIPDSCGGMGVNLSAHDAAHPIEGVRFENVTGYGRVTTRNIAKRRPVHPNVCSVLCPGAVRPRGWMLDRARAAAAGMSGHLDEYDEDFVRAYSPDFRPPVSNLTWQTGSWSFEGGSYWFDGAVRLAAQIGDEALARKIAARFDPVLSSATTNSLGLLTWLDRNAPDAFAGIAKADNAFALAKSGMLARSLSAYWQISGDDRVTNALAHAFDDVRILRLGNALHLPSAAYEAYRLTGDRATASALDEYFAAPDAITSVASCFSRPPDPAKFYMPNDPVRGADWRPQHGVLLNESMIAWLRGWQWTGDERYRSAVFGWMDWLDANVMQPHGVIVADEQFGYPGGDRGTETCTVAASIWLRLQLLQATGDGRWADGIERALFNAAPACVTRDYRRHVYFQSPNRTTPKRPEHRRGDVPTAPYRYERKHFPLCCTSDLTRMIPAGIQAKWLRDGDGLVAGVYGPDETVAEIDGGKVRLRTDTSYPFEENIRISVTTDRAASWTLKLRIPAWCGDSARLAVNGESVRVKPKRGYVAVCRTWRTGDKVELMLPMKPEIRVGTDRNTGKRYATVSLGPLLMSVPLREFDDNTPCWPQRSNWTIDPDHALDGAEVIRSAVKERFDWPLDAPVKVRIASGSERIDLVPYGSTRFRVSMFPIRDEVSAR